MPFVPPPDKPNVTPILTTLTSGTVLYRLHLARFSADSFNPTHASRYWLGGRFDATDDDDYGYAYFAATESVAIAETLPRGVAGDSSTSKITLAKEMVTGRRVSAVQLTADIEVVDLRDLVGLSHCSQDTWLVQAEPTQYAQTRNWAHWIRGRSPSANGFVWHSKRDSGTLAYILFGDRCPANLLADVSANSGLASGAAALDQPTGLTYLRGMLAPFNADIG